MAASVHKIKGYPRPEQEAPLEKGLLYQKEYQTLPEEIDDVRNQIDFIVKDLLQDVKQIVPEIFSEIQGNLRLVLSELINNAVIHGNLGLDSSEEAKGALVFGETLNDTLAENPELKEKLVYTSLCVTDDEIALHIADEGNGIQKQVPANSKKYSGRGGLIVNALCKSRTAIKSSPNGTIVSAHFPLPQKKDNVIPLSQ